MKFLYYVTSLSIVFGSSLGFTADADIDEKQLMRQKVRVQLMEKLAPPAFIEKFEKTTTLEDAISFIKTEFDGKFLIMDLFNEENIYRPLLPHLQKLANHPSVDKIGMKQKIKKEIYSHKYLKSLLDNDSPVYFKGKITGLNRFSIDQFVDKIFDPNLEIFKKDEIYTEMYNDVVRDFNDYIDKKKSFSTFLDTLKNSYKFLDITAVQQLIRDIVKAVQDSNVFTLDDCTDMLEFKKLVNDINTQQPAGEKFFNQDEYDLLSHDLTMKFMDIKGPPLKEKLNATLDLMWGNPYSLEYFKMLINRDLIEKNEVKQ